MKHIISIAFILLGITNTLAQHLAFDQLLQEGKYALSLSESSDGGFVVGGGIEFSDNYDWGHSHAIRLNSVGEIEWQQSYFQTQSSPQEEKYYPFANVLYHKASNKWFGVVNSFVGDIFLTKHFEGGSMQWQKNMEDPIGNAASHFKGITFSSDSNALFIQTGGFGGTLLRKFNLEGELIWEKRNIDGDDLFIDKLNDLFFVYYRAVHKVDTYKINEDNGDIISNYTTEGIIQIYDIKAREGGGYWCIGDPRNSSDMCVAALDENMDTLWTKTVYGPNKPINTNSLFYFVDYSQIFPSSSVHLITTSQELIESPIPLSRGLVIAIDNSGDSLWTYQHFKGDTSSRVRNAIRLENGSLVVIGIYGVGNNQTAGMFVFKINVDGSVGMSQNIAFEKNQTPYPNPTTSLLHTNNTTEKSIYNLQGQLLWQGQDEKVDVSQWEQGVYLLRTKEKTYRWIKN